MNLTDAYEKAQQSAASMLVKLNEMNDRWVAGHGEVPADDKFPVLTDEELQQQFSYSFLSYIIQTGQVETGDPEEYARQLETIGFTAYLKRQEELDHQVLSLSVTGPEKVKNPAP